MFKYNIKIKCRREMLMNCPNCDSTNIAKGVSIGKSAKTGNVGPKFSSGLFTGVAQMYCDICLNCGEIRGSL